MSDFMAYCQQDGIALLHDDYLPERTLWIHVIARAIWDWNESIDQVEYIGKDGKRRINGNKAREIGELEIWTRGEHIGSLRWIADYCSPNPEGMVGLVLTMMTPKKLLSRKRGRLVITRHNTHLVRGENGPLCGESGIPVRL